MVTEISKMILKGPKKAPLTFQSGPADPQDGPQDLPTWLFMPSRWLEDPAHGPQARTENPLKNQWEINMLGIGGLFGPKMAFKIPR